MASRSKDDSSSSVVRIPPFHYIHVLDINSNVTRLEIGPKTFIRQDHERLIKDPEKMIIIPPMNFCIILNPVIRNEDGEVQLDAFGQVKLAHADQEVRLSQDPFPLYPGESLKSPVTPLKIIPLHSALRLNADMSFIDDDGVHRQAGDQWLFEGPGTYIPRKEVSIKETLAATVIMPNQALRLCAKRGFTDRNNQVRVCGEEWLVRTTGAYMPGAYEEVIDTVDAIVLTEKKALHLSAIKTFRDDYNIVRKSGEEWLITFDRTDSHIPNVYENVVGVVDITTLNNRQYCFILDPADESGRPQLGRKRLVRGEKAFFLLPGERLEHGIQDIYVLGDNEGLILRALEEHVDAETEQVRIPGDRWMIRGPMEYVPPVAVEVVRKQTTIPLDENEGIYVRDIKTGKVRAVTGQTYMLNHEEELWHKELPAGVEHLLSMDIDPLADRSSRPPMQSGFGALDARTAANMASGPPFGATKAKKRDWSQVVSFRVPHNAAVQVYDYKAKKARVCFGPDLVMLAPDEQFTQLSLSGGKPKQPNVIKSLCLLLGPDFCTDIITVETADHARLSLQVSYNWHFDVDPPHKSRDELAHQAQALFSVPDFVGDMCKAVASRIRGAVASVQFDDFHKNSARIIRSSVFGLDEAGRVRPAFRFEQNLLVITSIDIQSVEPVDQRTRDSLQKSVQLAIEITTSSQEAAARHEAERREQEARGRLERQKIKDQAEAEGARRDLLELQALSEAVASTGQAKAEALSRAEAARIEGEAAVEQARLKCRATEIQAESELQRLKTAREAELAFLRERSTIELGRKREETEIEVGRYQRLVEAIGASTLLEISRAGPEMEVRLLQAMNLQSTLITDGNSPINLFTTAKGLLGKHLAAAPTNGGL